MMVHAGILLQILNIVKHVLFLNRQEIFAAGRQKTYNQSYFIQSVNKIKDTFEAFNFCAVCFYFYPAMTAFTDQYSLPNNFFDIGQL